MKSKENNTNGITFSNLHFECYCRQQVIHP